MKCVVSLIAAGVSLAATVGLAGPAMAQGDVPECGTSVPGLWWWKKGNPLQIEKFVQYSGLREGEYIGAIDFDAGAGVLYGMGSHGGVYSIDGETGAASFMGSVGFDPDFPCGNDILWWKVCPGCPPPGPPKWDFVIQQDLIMEVTLDPAGLGVQFRAGPTFPASSQHAGVVPRITGLAALPSAVRGPASWDIYAYDAATCGLYKIDQLANHLLELDRAVAPGCWPPDGGVIAGMDAEPGPRPHPWISFTIPQMVGTSVSTMFAGIDTDIAGAQMELRGLVGSSDGLEILDHTAVVMDGACPADLNGDGLIDFTDYLEFLNLFDAQDPRADFNGDGLIDFADYLEFLNHYDAGC